MNKILKRWFGIAGLVSAGVVPLGAAAACPSLLDHSFTTLQDGKPVFANASHHVAEAEWNFWTNPDLPSKMPEAMKGMVQTTQAQLAGIKDKVAMFKPGAEVVRGINVIDIVSFLERETGKVRIDMLSPSWIIFSGGFHRDPIREGAERVFDVFAAIVLLALTWPIAVLAWLAIKLEDGWSAPAFYIQERVGLEGKLFNLRKFRSMRIDAEKGGQAKWASKDDPRVTRVGKFMRKTRIDELPQLLNVLSGDMCFVGPRPERPQFVDQLTERIPYYRERHWVKPGLTGWAQLCYPYGASERDAKEKLQYDLYYVKHRSLVFDLFILLGTAEVILWGRGAR